MVLGVGVIGASPDRSWSAVSHIPALKTVPGLELRALATSNPRSAAAAEAAFGAKTYADPGAMIGDPAVDVVAVTVRVPAHRDLVLAALEARKHVYCEWPLGRDFAEAEALRVAAESAGVHAVVGLQARANPALRRAAALIAEGAIGRVLTARLHAETMAFGPHWGEADAYLEDPANGATHLAIHGGHAVDAVMATLGPFADVVALLTTQYPEITVGDPPVSRARTIPDDVRVMGRLASGAGVTVEVVGGRGQDSRFELEITGTSGTLALRGGAVRGFQSGRLGLSLDGADQDVPEGEATGLPAPAVNVAHAYAALRDDVANGTRTVPGFDHGVRLTRLCDDLSASSADGARRLATGWPQG